MKLIISCQFECLGLKEFPLNMRSRERGFTGGFGTSQCSAEGLLKL